LAMLKEKYGMSMQAWVYRAKDLGIITDSYAAILFRTFRSMGWSLKEPKDVVPPEKPRQLERLILRALSEDMISPARAAELVGKPLNEFREQMRAELVRTEAAAGSALLLSS
ncbi:MAG: transcriptional regulator, partial [Candidatus Kryptoniota bacterium]